MFGNCLHQQIWRVADIGQRAKQCAPNEIAINSRPFSEIKSRDLRRFVDVQAVKSESSREEGQIGRRVIEQCREEAGRPIECSCLKSNPSLPADCSMNSRTGIIVPKMPRKSQPTSLSGAKVKLLASRIRSRRCQIRSQRSQNHERFAPARRDGDERAQNAPTRK